QGGIGVDVVGRTGQDGDVAIRHDAVLGHRQVGVVGTGAVVETFVGAVVHGAAVHAQDVPGAVVVGALHEAGVDDPSRDAEVAVVVEPSGGEGPAGRRGAGIGQHGV